MLFDKKKPTRLMRNEMQAHVGLSRAWGFVLVSYALSPNPRATDPVTTYISYISYLVSPHWHLCPTTPIPHHYSPRYGIHS